jgi:DNA-directed RNA polymerase specialized sigma24 family protein
MIDHPMDTHCTNDGEPSTAPGGIPTERLSPVSLLSNPLYGEMSLPVLAAHCIRELNTYHRGEPCTESYSVELLRRATVQGDQEAWTWVQHCFGGVVLNWLRRHPQRAHACRLESDEYYVAQAFERFWQATALNQRMDFSTLAAALGYLRASVEGAILDRLRASARPREISRPVPGEPGEPLVEDAPSSSEVWDILKTLLSNPREVRVAYLLFHCGLSPQEIVHVCPHEFDDVREVSCLRRTIMERVLRNADLLRWQLANSVQKEQGRRR